MTALIWLLASLVMTGHAGDLIDLQFVLGPSQLFGEWMTRYGITYQDSSEQAYRQSVFEANRETINGLNNENGGDVKFDLNIFADMTQDEFRSRRLVSLGYSEEPPVERRSTPSDTSNVDKRQAPPTFDWTVLNMVTPVRDQGSAGTCYAFSALAVLESQWAIKGNGHVSLSTEEVAACVAATGPTFNDQACGVKWGWSGAVFNYVINNGGISSESNWPYGVGKKTTYPCAPANYDVGFCGPWPIADCKQQDSCSAKYSTSNFVPGLKVISWTRWQGPETEKPSLLVEHGPMTASLNADTLQFYKRGVLPACESNYATHMVTLVGFGGQGQSKYWKAKNSWGVNWGENGFFRIKRDVNACGINNVVVSAELE